MFARLAIICRLYGGFDGEDERKQQEEENSDLVEDIKNNAEVHKTVTADTTVILHQLNYCLEVCLRQSLVIKQSISSALDIVAELDKIVQKSSEGSLSFAYHKLILLSQCIVDFINVMETISCRDYVNGIVLSYFDKPIIEECIINIDKAVNELRQALNEKLGLTALENQSKDSRLSELSNILKVSSCDLAVQQHLRSHNYQPNSRAWLHCEVDEWLNSGNNNSNSSSEKESLKNKVFWLQAGAGMGKSVFAAALVDRMNREQQQQNSCGSRLLGAVFIKFNDEKASNPVNVLKSLIYQIALRYPATIDFVLKTLESVKNESESVVLYYESVLIPLLNEIVEKHNNSSNLLIVIDALDEAGVEGSALRKDFLQLFSVRNLRQLPLRVKLLVTGRPEVDVKDKLLSFSHVIDENDGRHVDDLKSYIRFSLEQVFGQDRVDVVDAAAAILLLKSENKFLYTAVVAEQISEWYGSEGDEVFSVEDFMLKLNGLPDGIDGSYRQTFVKLSAAVREDKWHEFLMCMVSSMEPLSECELKYLLNMDHVDDASEFKRLMDHVVTVFPLRESVNERSGESVRKFYPFHKSVVDWLMNSDKSGEFYCDAKKSNVLMCHKLLSKLEIIDNRTMGIVDESNIKVKVNLLELVGNDNNNDSIMYYLLKHWLTHLDKCEVQLKYQYVSHYLLTYLPWIQCCLKLFGLEWLIREYRKRSIDNNWLLSQCDCRDDIVLLYKLLMLISGTKVEEAHFDWCNEICTQIHARLSEGVRNSKRIEQLVCDAKDYIEKYGGWLIDSDNILSKPDDAVDILIGWSEYMYEVSLISSGQVVCFGKSRLCIYDLNTGECVKRMKRLDGLMSNLILIGDSVVCIIHNKLVRLCLFTESWEIVYDSRYSNRDCVLLSYSSSCLACYNASEFLVFDSTLQLVKQYKSTNHKKWCFLSESIVITTLDDCLYIWNLNDNSYHNIMMEEKWFEVKRMAHNQIICSYSGSVIIIQICLERFTAFVVHTINCSRAYGLCVLSENSFMVLEAVTIKQFTDYSLDKIYEFDYRIERIEKLSNNHFLLKIYKNAAAVWNPLKHVNRHFPRIDSLLLSLSDGRVVTNSSNKICIWDIGCKTVEWEKEMDYVDCAYELPDGRLAVIINKDKLQIWTIGNNEPDGIHEFACDFGPKMFVINNVLVIMSCVNRDYIRRYYAYFYLDSMSFGEPLFNFDDDCYVINLLSPDEIVYRKFNKCYLYSISTRESKPIYNSSSVFDAYYVNKDRFQLTSNLVDVIVNSNTLKLEANVNYDWDYVFAGTLYLSARQEFYNENEMHHFIKIPNSNKVVFQGFGLVFAAYFNKVSEL